MSLLLRSLSVCFVWFPSFPFSSTLCRLFNSRQQGIIQAKKPNKGRREPRAIADLSVGIWGETMSLFSSLFLWGGGGEIPVGSGVNDCHCQLCESPWNHYCVPVRRSKNKMRKQYVTLVLFSWADWIHLGWAWMLCCILSIRSKQQSLWFVFSLPRRFTWRYKQHGGK